MLRRHGNIICDVAPTKEFSVQFDSEGLWATLDSSNARRGVQQQILRIFRVPNNMMMRSSKAHQKADFDGIRSRNPTTTTCMRYNVPVTVFSSQQPVLKQMCLQNHDTNRQSRSAVVAPPTFLSRNSWFRNQLPVVSPEIRCPSTPSPTSSTVRPLHARKYINTFFFSSILPCVEQP